MAVEVNWKILVYGIVIVLTILLITPVVADDSVCPACASRPIQIIYQNSIVQDTQPPAKATKTTLEESALKKGAEYAPYELFVKFKTSKKSTRNGIEAAAQRSTIASLNGVLKTDYSKYSLDGLYLVQFAKTDNLLETKAKLDADPAIEYTSLNYIRHLVATPDDPSYNLLWGLHNTGQTGGTPDADIDAPEAWDTTTGSGSVIVAVLDTGVDYNHADLKDNIWTNPGEIPDNGIDDDGNGYIDDYYGWDFGTNDNDPMDSNGHGTHCAGTIGAMGNNALGVTGVNWNVSIMALKGFRRNGYLYDSDAINAILYAGMMKATIVSCSWGGAGYNQALKDVIDASPC